jgi:Rrf2 family protein
MLSQTAEHAIRALLYLAGTSAGRAASAEEIATAIGAPKNYLAKTLNSLARGGFVSATRGPGGGFRLAMDPSEVRVARVLEAFDPPAQRPICLLGGRPCNELAPCVAHARWLSMWKQSLIPLQRTSLADLLGSDGAVSGEAA